MSPDSDRDRARDFESLYRDHAAMRLRQARRVLQDRQMAEDAVQEAFAAHWADPARYDAARSAPTSWLRLLTHRKAVDRVRREQRRGTLPLDAAGHL